MERTIVFKEESYRIVGACFEVYKEQGSGFLEGVYQEPGRSGTGRARQTLLQTANPSGNAALLPNLLVNTRAGRGL